MSTYFTGSAQQRQLVFGNTTKGAAKVLPATATGNLFAVAGGRIIITSMVATCTTVCTATATTVSIGVTPTVGSASTTGVATASAVTSAEVGSLLSLPTVKGALIANVLAGGAAQVASDGYVVNIGNITWTTSATNTGAFSWVLTWMPYDDGASVTAL